MITENPVSMRTSPARVKRFVRHVVRAAKKQEEKKRAKEALKRQVRKVKKISVTKGIKKELIEKELKKLEDYLKEVLEKEGKLIVASKRDTEVTEYLKEEIKRLENKVGELRQRDIELIEMLRDQIKGLEQELRITEHGREEETSVNKLEIENISKAVVELRERIKQFVVSRTERERRIAELEKRIKEKVGKNYAEILKLEKQLRAMEEKYELVRKEGVYDKSILQEIGDKIKQLRQRLIMKKAGVGAEEAKFVPKIKIKKPPLFRKRVIPGKKLFVRHEMKIEPIKEQPEEKLKPGKLPPLPPLPRRLEALRKLEEVKPKPGFVERIKGLFKKKKE